MSGRKLHTVCFLLLISATPLVSGPRTARTLMIFKSERVRHPLQEPGPKPPSPPLNLSAAERKQLLKSLNPPALSGPGTTYMKVTAREPNVNGKGYLNFSNADYVSGGDGQARWMPSADEKASYLQITVKSEAAGRRYLIDCAVQPFVKSNGPFIIRNYGGDLLQTIESTGDQGQHLLFALEASDSNWNSLRISRAMGWYFFSCEVTNF